MQRRNRRAGVEDVRLGDRFDGERGDVAVLGVGSLLAVGTPTAGEFQIGVSSPGSLRIENGGDVYSYGGSVGDLAVLDDLGQRIESGTVANEISGASVAPTIEPVAKITAEFAPVSACAAASRTTLDRARASSAISSAAVTSIIQYFRPMRRRSIRPH